MLTRGYFIINLHVDKTRFVLYITHTTLRTGRFLHSTLFTFVIETAKILTISYSKFFKYHYERFFLEAGTENV